MCLTNDVKICVHFRVEPYIYKGITKETTMSKTLNRRQLQRMLLNEFKMIGMLPMGGMGHMKSIADSGCGDDHDEPQHFQPADAHMGHSSHRGVVSKEDCCAAVMCLIECCSCPETRRILSDACERLLHS